MPSRQHARAYVVAALGAASLFALILLAARMRHAGDLRHAYLAWNLMLAWVPLIAALVIYDRARRGAGRRGQVALGLVWLAFFPNAPYIVTDLVHLRDATGVPPWLDAFVYASFACTGLLLGLVSLFLVHAVLRGAVGPARAWWWVGGAIGLAGFGIYLGRFLWWNSWDVVANPGTLLGDIASRLSDPAEHPRTVAVTLIVTGFVAVTYLVVYAMSQLRTEGSR